MSTEQPKKRAGRKKNIDQVKEKPEEQKVESVTTEQTTTPADNGAETAVVAPKEAKKPRVKKQTVNQLEAVLNHYTEAGWTAVRQTSGGLNDIIAHRDKKMHFVQVVTKPDDARYTGIALNTFIQNAMSNNVLPIHARVQVEENRDGVNVVTKITFTNVNDNTRVFINKARAAK